MSGLAIRWRLTLWYSSILAATFALASVGVYLLMQRQLMSRTDANLQDELRGVEKELEESSTADGFSARLHRRFGHYERLLFDIRKPDSAEPLFGRHLGDDPFPAPVVQSSEFALSTFQATDGRRWRIASRAIPGPDGPILTRAAVALADDEHLLADLLRALLLMGGLALVSSFAGGYLLARRALAPIDRMTRIAQQITELRLDRRVEVPNQHDELGRLATTLNAMISRLERAFAEMQRFTADAAHELRTPVTIIRNEAEVTLRAPRTAAEYRHSLENLLEEAEHLTHLADQLLFLSREDSGMDEAARTTVQLDQLVADVGDHLRVLANEKNLAFDCQVNQPCCILGNADQLRRLLFNLVENSIKYTDPGGKVTVGLSRFNGKTEIVVADTGMGIAADQLANIFARFYRAEGARASAGAGLGLAISKAVVDWHGGTIQVDSKIGRGTRVTVNLKSLN